MHRPWSWLASTAFVAAVLGLGLQRLELRTDEAALYPAGEPAVERTWEDRRAFSETDEIIVLLTARAGAAPIASPRGLRLIKQVHESLRTVPGIDAERLRSLASVLDPQPGMPLMVIPQALDTIPDGDDECRALLDRLRRNPLVAALFLSPDGRAAAIYAPVARDRDHRQVLAQVERRLAPVRSAELDLRMTGPVAAAAARGATVLRDLARLTPITAGVIAGLCILCLRSVGGTIIPLATIAVVLLCTMGGMGWARIPVTLVTPILPVVLCALAATGETRLLDRVRSCLEAGSGSVPDALGQAFRDVGRPMVLTSVTTGVAFLPLLATSIAPLRWFGLCAVFGVLLSLLLSFTLLPALLQVLPLSWLKARDPNRSERRPESSLVERLALCPGVRGGLLGGALLLVAVPGLLRLGSQDSWIDHSDPASDVAAAQRAYDEAFWGGRRFDVVLTSAQTTFFQRVEGIRIVEGLVRVARAAPRVAGVISHVAAHEILADVYGEKVPVSQLPPDHVLWFSSLLQKIQRRIDLDHYLKRDGSVARIRLFLKGADDGRSGEVRTYLERAIPGVLEGTGVRYHFSGDLPAAEAAGRSIVANLLQSLGWTVAGTGLVLAFALRSARLAGVGLAPLLGALVMTLGGVGYAGVPLGIATCTIGAVVIGGGADSCLHFLHGYVKARDSGCDHPGALQATTRSTGRVTRWNVVILAAGLSVLALSTTKPQRALGVLLSAAMPACYVMTLLLLPFLLRTPTGIPKKAVDRA
jgi:predicted RND superfamily exporter protein